ncbi:ankyrin repeat and LEM domain-containing protein 1-like [Pectinophora gossypiella]|uniref:ankyrin repeat and LEM domain-containing protein 1-like n=1 Tax=Pectinophora gossypiella TaxID=13191 RepID=UPI00214E2495|nr:ankyrin repeat and LEM domain-containing protein 1-like [Pectinophora gossypiella]
MGSSYKNLFKLYDLIQSGDTRSVEAFLSDNKLEINEILPCKGIGVLHLAVGIEPEDKSKECTEILLRHGGDPNLSNYEGITPLHIAAIWGRLDNLKLLIGCGGDPSCRDFDGHSAFDYAAREQQWAVFDYLHNVEDELDDSSAPQCAYSLDLEKIIVSTDHMVAEYETIPENKTWNATCRKSEMVRDWCEKTSLTMNKLYPTILTDTFTIDNDPELWKSIYLTKNMTYDLSTDLNNQNNLNETSTTFKTCLSKKISPYPVEISGIERLHITSDESKECSEKRSSTDSQKQRFSMYENFSLPGSPNSITHRNYNTKTSLKKNLSKDSAEKKLTFDKSRSLLTDDNDRSLLDKALAVAQNRTNEWLSSSSREQTEVKDAACNTRRPSASSGVSSNFSSGSIVIANVHEEYKYEDKEENVVLIEKRLLVSPVVLPVEDPADNSPDSTVLSVASSLPASVDYDNNTLRAELLRRGFRPGPIQDSTRTLYLKKLHALKKNPIVASGQGKTYSIEMEKSLRTDDWMKNLTPYMELETKAREDFANPNRKWREGTAKTSFTYLLLDPRLTGNLPAKAGTQGHHISWVTFVNSIFYVGKGKRSRPYSHLYQALTLWKRDFTQSKDKKVQHILDIWSDKVGVVCLHIFQNVIPAEAYTYEASMIDVLGLQNLKNLKSGNYYGSVASWPHKDRRMLGLYLLYKAMLIFLSEGERQLRPDDID